MKAMDFETVILFYSFTFFAFRTPLSCKKYYYCCGFSLIDLSRLTSPKNWFLHKAILNSPRLAPLFSNKYALKTLLNLGNNLDYDTILSLSDMQSLESRRYYSSLVLLYKCINSNGPQYIKNFFQTRYTKYILRSRGINLEQSGYNNKLFHNSFTYIVSRLWNKLPAHIETSSKFSEFTRNLKAFDFSKLGPSCHCNSCI